MSLEVIRNGAFWVLTTCGPWVASEVSTCDFGILEGVSGCGIVFLPGANTRIDPDRIGRAPARNYLREWHLRGGLYIKFTGDPARLLARVWQGHDDLFNTIAKDDTLNSAACAARLQGLAYNQDTFVNWGGQDFAVVGFDWRAEEF